MGWGYTDGHGKLWSYEDLVDIRKSIEANGLKWEAIENFDPAHWHDVLLDGPRKKEQLEDLKRTIQNVGRAGIPIMGYNFSMAGVWGWTKGPFGRGGAISQVYDESKIDSQTPIPNGMIWNMIYDRNAPEGNVPPVSPEELWQRYEWFLTQIIPVAEENGVKMALHPDDPPADFLRGTARLVNQPHKYQRVLDLAPSPANTLEFCLGSLQEMREGDVYESIEHYGRQGKIAYVHFRNVRGKVPHYQEVFVDEGDLDMLRALSVLREVGYDGVVIPDHTPEMSCDAPWHAGMAFALGYIKAAMQAVERVGTIPAR
jgi:mannonate dehydratase